MKDWSAQVVRAGFFQTAPRIMDTADLYRVAFNGEVPDNQQVHRPGPGQPIQGGEASSDVELGLATIRWLAGAVEVSLLPRPRGVKEGEIVPLELRDVGTAMEFVFDASQRVAPVIGECFRTAAIIQFSSFNPDHHAANAALAPLLANGFDLTDELDFVLQLNRRRLFDFDPSIEMNRLVRCGVDRVEAGFTIQPDGSLAPGSKGPAFYYVASVYVDVNVVPTGRRLDAHLTVRTLAEVKEELDAFRTGKRDLLMR